MSALRRADQGRVDINSLMIRLNQAVKGAACPHEIVGPVAATQHHLDHVVFQAYKKGQLGQRRTFRAVWRALHP